MSVRRAYFLSRREASQVVSIYRECFMPEQRIAESSLIGTIHETRDSKRNAFFIAEHEGCVVGFALVLFFPSFRIAHLMYLGVGALRRHLGVGRLLFDAIADRCRAFEHPPHWVTVEVLRPETAGDDHERQERRRAVDFLQALGCERMHADFQAPPLGAGFPVVPYWIMACPIAQTELSPALIPDTLIVLYRMVYGLAEDHSLVTHCLKSIDPDWTPGTGSRSPWSPPIS